MLLEHAPEVEKYKPQPLTITIKSENGINKNYTPDVLIYLKNDSKLLVEVKPLEIVSKQYEKHGLKWKEIEKWCKEKGLTFKILTENEIRTPRLANVWFTYGASLNRNNAKYMKILNKFLKSKGKNGYEYN